MSPWGNILKHRGPRAWPGHDCQCKFPETKSHSHALNRCSRQRGRVPKTSIKRRQAATAKNQGCVRKEEPKVGAIDFATSEEIRQLPEATSRPGVEWRGQLPSAAEGNAPRHEPGAQVSRPNRHRHATCSRSLDQECCLICTPLPSLHVFY